MLLVTVREDNIGTKMNSVIAKSSKKPIYKRIFRKKLHTGKRINRSTGANIVITLILGIIGIFMALPLVYAVVNAFKPLEEFYIYPPKFYVMHPTMDNFGDLFKLSTNQWVPFLRYVFNSVFVSVIATLLHIFVAATAAYVLSKHEFRGKAVLNIIIVLSLLFSSKVISIPQYIIMSGIQFVDTPYALIAPVVASSLGVFLLKQFVDMFPNEIIESSRIDGASEMRICWSIVMPMVKPAVITVAIFAFQNIWNNSGQGLIYSEANKVLPMFLQQIAASNISRAGVGAASTFLLLIPPILLFMIFQSKIIETMSASGIKG